MTAFCVLLMLNIALASCYSRTALLQSKTHKDAELQLVHMLLNTRAASFVQQKACSSYYFPELEACSKEYDSDLNICNDHADDARNHVLDGISPIRQNIDKMSNDVCHDLTDCQKLSYLIDYLDCCENVATYDVNLLFSIASNATAAKTNIQIEYQLIDGNENLCQNAAFKVYQQKWNAKSKEWNDCVAGKTEVPKTNSTATTES